MADLMTLGGTVCRMLLSFTLEMCCRVRDCTASWLMMLLVTRQTLIPAHRPLRD